MSYIDTWKTDTGKMPPKPPMCAYQAGCPDCDKRKAEKVIACAVHRCADEWEWFWLIVELARRDAAREAAATQVTANAHPETECSLPSDSRADG